MTAPSSARPARGAAQVPAPRPAGRGPETRKETAMLLIHEELARSHREQLQREAHRLGRARRLAHARRLRRRAEEAGRRARLAALAIR